MKVRLGVFWSKNFSASAPFHQQIKIPLKRGLAHLLHDGGVMILGDVAVPLRVFNIFMAQ
jgi:hypothetical protein